MSESIPLFFDHNGMWIKDMPIFSKKTGISEKVPFLRIRLKNYDGLDKTKLLLTFNNDIPQPPYEIWLHMDVDSPKNKFGIETTNSPSSFIVVPTKPTVGIMLEFKIIKIDKDHIGMKFKSVHLRGDAGMGIPMTDDEMEAAYQKRKEIEKETEDFLSEYNFHIMFTLDGDIYSKLYSFKSKTWFEWERRQINGLLCGSCLNYTETIPYCKGCE